MEDLCPRSSDDEETLQMKENLLKIRLKKKQLAKQSPKKAEARPVTPPPPPCRASPYASPKAVQVLASPSPRRTKVPTSPARIILGIDKGRTGRDVSLKRTPDKPKKSFNQRLLETKTDYDKKEDTRRERASKRLTSFNKIPAFRGENKDTEADPITKFNICERVVAASDCERAAGTVSKVMSVKQFYAACGPPDFMLPAEIDNYIVYGIIASKSTARVATNHAKYCVFSITDLITEINLFLYEHAFEKYWTLPLGSVCYFLNPAYQKAVNGAGNFSLKVTDGMSVLEIAKSADYGICRSIRKDGKQCTRWVNARKQEVCDEHVDMALGKSLNKRLEFASGTRQFDPRVKSKKKKAEEEHYAQHAVFFGNNVTTMRSGSTGDFDQPVRDMARVQKELEARQREREVLAKLMKTSAVSAGHEYFEMTDPNAMSPEDLDVEEANRVFNAVMLRKIGFDPTRRANGLGAPIGSAVVAQAEADLQRSGDAVDLKVEPGRGTRIMLGQDKKSDGSDSELEIVH